MTATYSSIKHQMWVMPNGSYKFVTSTKNYKYAIVGDNRIVEKFFSEKAAIKKLDWYSRFWSVPVKIIGRASFKYIHP